VCRKLRACDFIADPTGRKASLMVGVTRIAFRPWGRLSAPRGQPITETPWGAVATSDDNGVREQRLAAQADRLKRLRQAAGLTHARLAEALDLHVNTISGWERGLSEIEFSNAVMLANVLDVPLRDVLGADPPRKAVPATDETLRESFDSVTKRISELRAAMEQRLDRQDKSLRELSLAVRALQRSLDKQVEALQAQPQATPGKRAASARTRRGDPRPPDQPS
jgi:transcriptional regulator with XRE-family HTH domain